MPRRNTLILVVAGACVVLLAWVASAGAPQLWRTLDFDSPPARPTPVTQPQDTVPATTLPPVEEIEPVDLGWLLSGLLVLLAVGLIIAVVWWLSRRDWSRPRRTRLTFQPLPEVAPDELLEAADEFDTLIARGSARNAIVACWVRLEEAVEQAGLVRDPAATPAETTARVLRSYDVDGPAIETLAALYREARFSVHDMHEGHRQQAQGALAEIRRQLRAQADLVAAEAVR